LNTAEATPVAKTLRWRPIAFAILLQKGRRLVFMRFQEGLKGPRHFVGESFWSANLPCGNRST
jgi:hypothetical protein